MGYCHERIELRACPLQWNVLIFENIGLSKNGPKDSPSSQDDYAAGLLFTYLIQNFRCHEARTVGPDSQSDCVAGT